MKRERERERERESMYNRSYVIVLTALQRKGGKGKEEREVTNLTLLMGTPSSDFPLMLSILSPVLILPSLPRTELLSIFFTRMSPLSSVRLIP